MVYLSQTDLDVRISLIEDYLSEFGASVCNSTSYGLHKAKKDFKTLALIALYTEIIEIYQPITGDVVEADNPITETQLQSILDHISMLTGITFASIGTTYSS